MFTVDARHMNISMAFLTQRMFVNDESFRQISQNCDYFVIFKNPRNSSEIRALAQQMTPGNLILVDIFIDATQMPFSYLLINLTQECNSQVKFLSNIFGDVQVYIPEGKTFKKITGNGKFYNFKLNSGYSNRQSLKSFRPTFTHHEESCTNDNIQEKNIYMPQDLTKFSQMPLIKHETDTHFTNTPMKLEKFAQTLPIRNAVKSTSIPLKSEKFVQTTPILSSNVRSSTFESQPSFQSIYARSLQSEPEHMQIDDTEYDQQIMMNPAEMRQRQNMYQKQTENIPFTQQKMIEQSHKPLLSYMQPNAIQQPQQPNIQPLAVVHHQAPRIQHLQPTNR